MATKKAAPKKKVSKKKSTKRKVNKSAAIRAYLAAHPSASTAEVVAGLKQQGVSVSTNYVSNVKSTKSKAKKKPAIKKAKGTSPVEDVKQAGSLMFQAIDLVLQAGVKEARAMVEMAGKMVDRVSDEKK